MSDVSASKWLPITDLPNEWSKLASPEFASLAVLWKEQFRELRHSNEIRRFEEALKREWAIETGIIEGLYSLDRGITQLLIERGIEASLIPHHATDKPVEEVIAIVRDQRDALELVFDFVASRRPLTTSYVKELHALLTQHQDTVSGIDQFGRKVEMPLLRGEYKQRPNSPTRNGVVHEYCPPEHTASKMDQLIEMHCRHTAEQVPPEVEAAWLHHRFTRIHPFHDGNGRVARAIASLVLLRAEWFPLVVHRDRRDAYISALESADSGDLAPLVGLFVDIQRRALRKALSIGEALLQSTDALDGVVAAAIDKLRKSTVTPAQRMTQAAARARQVEDFVLVTLQRRAADLAAQLKTLNPRFVAVANHSQSATDRYYRAQIITAAKELEYYADTSSYRSWIRLHIKTDLMCDILFVLHGLGYRPTGLMAVTAFAQFRNRKSSPEVDDEGQEFDGPHLLCDDVFQFSYNESFTEVKKRFEPWFEKALLLGLDQWRRSL